MPSNNAFMLVNKNGIASRFTPNWNMNDSFFNRQVSNALKIPGLVHADFEQMWLYINPETADVEGVIALDVTADAQTPLTNVIKRLNATTLQVWSPTDLRDRCFADKTDIFDLFINIMGSRMKVGLTEKEVADAEDIGLFAINELVFINELLNDEEIEVIGIGPACDNFAQDGKFYISFHDGNPLYKEMDSIITNED